MASGNRVEEYGAHLMSKTSLTRSPGPFGGKAGWGEAAAEAGSQSRPDRQCSGGHGDGSGFRPMRAPPWNACRVEHAVPPWMAVRSRLGPWRVVEEGDGDVGRRGLLPCPVALASVASERRRWLCHVFVAVCLSLVACRLSPFVATMATCLVISGAWSRAPTPGTDGLLGHDNALQGREQARCHDQGLFLRETLIDTPRAAPWPPTGYR